MLFNKLTCWPLILEKLCSPPHNQPAREEIKHVHVSVTHPKNDCDCLITSSGYKVVMRCGYTFNFIPRESVSFFHNQDILEHNVCLMLTHCLSSQ